jgi:hypothetical protein
MVSTSGSSAFDGFKHLARGVAALILFDELLAAGPHQP